MIFSFTKSISSSAKSRAALCDALISSRAHFRSTLCSDNFYKNGELHRRWCEGFESLQMKGCKIPGPKPTTELLTLAHETHLRLENAWLRHGLHLSTLPAQRRHFTAGCCSKNFSHLCVKTAKHVSLLRVVFAVYKEKENAPSKCNAREGFLREGI